MTTVKPRPELPPDPTPSAELDKQLKSMIRNSTWMVVALFVASLAALAAALFMLANQSGSTQKAVRETVANECVFFRDIGEAPANPKSTELGFKILVDSRNIFLDLGCEGSLAPPSQELRDLAAKYDLKLEG